MNLICLFILVGWPFLTLGVGLQKGVVDKDKFLKEVITSLIVFLLTYTVYYYAGVFKLLTDAL